MARKKTAAPGGDRAKAIATIEPVPLTASTEAALAPAVGSGRGFARLQGAGGEVVREDGITRVTGRDYAMRGGTVPAAEVYFVDDAKPRDEGPWIGEADKLAWVDAATGYECIVMRSNPRGYLSGYVGVPEGHPLFGWNHAAIPDELGVEVHGGLTYSRVCDEGPSPRRRLVSEVRRICHVYVEAPLVHATGHRAHPGQWWFGFQCDHVYDVVPGDRIGTRRFMGAETEAEYRDDSYVVREVRNLAAQLRAIADGRPVPPREGPPIPAIGLDPQGGR
jgi:hypothetical protein